MDIPTLGICVVLMIINSDLSTDRRPQKLNLCRVWDQNYWIRFQGRKEGLRIPGGG